MIEIYPYFELCFGKIEPIATKSFLRTPQAGQSYEEANGLSSTSLPETLFRSAWNWSLHVTSSCHRIKIYSVNKKRELTQQRLSEFQRRKEGFVPITRPTDFPQMTWEDYDEYWKKNQPRDVQSDDGGSDSE